MNRKQLSLLGTAFGLIVGTCGVLTTYELGNPKLVGTIGGLASVCLGIVVQHESKEAE